jgi:Fe-S cluster biogenesis protein NfuA
MNDEVRKRVEEVVAADIRPLLQRDGGDIEILDVTDGIVRVRMHGTCGGCPTSILAAIMEVEAELRKRVPEVEYLEAAP